MLPKICHQDFQSRLGPDCMQGAFRAPQQGISSLVRYCREVEKPSSVRHCQESAFGCLHPGVTIDDTVAQLLQEKAAEIKHKDFSVEEFNSNHLQTENKWTYSQTAVGEMQVQM